MANKQVKKSNLNQQREKKTIAEEIQLRLAQLDKKSSNISQRIDHLQKRLDNANKSKSEIEKLKGELAKVKKSKELELDEISLMCNIYSKETNTHLQIQEVESPVNG
jgi:hypothetical protein